MRAIILATFLLPACASDQENLMAADVNQKKEKLEFTGSVKVLPKAKPWEAVQIEYKNTDGDSSVSSVPLEKELINRILNQSNFRPTEGMMHEVAQLYFQGSFSKCPDGSMYLLKDKGGVKLCEVNVVDGNGRLWRLSVKLHNGKHSFSAKKKRKVYPSLKRFGS